MHTKKHDYTEKEDNKYDDYVSLEYQWHGHEIIFGLLFEYLKKGQFLLDLGIGTGLSSSYFKQMGLMIYGVDNSKEMIEICKKKKLTEELKLIDLVKDNFSFECNYFDYTISCGVFHFIEDLGPIFKKTKNVLKKEGIFCFTVKDTDNPGIIESYHNEAQVNIYSHGSKYIEKLIERYNFKLLKKQKFLGVNNPLIDEGYFIVYVLKK